MPSTECRTRCVLLAPQGDRTPDRGESLRSLLDQRGWIAHETHDALGALAELCLRERTQSLREEWGLQTAEQLALVVVEPTRWAELPEMLAAAARYVPKASRWWFDQGDLQPLGPDGQDDESSRRETPDAPATEGERTSVVGPPLISGEEIAMLLEGEDRDPQ
ncbi:MAG: hypothetical protein ACYSU7_08630 [Planctomycetota bacterium]